MVMSWVMHSVLPEDLQPADHIYRWGSPVHNHHGIVLEVLEEPQPPVADLELQDRIVVLHFSLDGMGQAKVHSVTLRQFLAPTLKTPLRGGPLHGLKRARYGCPNYETWIKRSGTCYPDPASPPEECLARARSLLEESELQPYNLSTLAGANCEHFAVWCTTGQWRSSQVDRARLIGTVGLFGAMGPIGLCGALYLLDKLVGQEKKPQRRSFGANESEVDAFLVGEGSDELSGDTQEPGDDEEISEDDEEIRLSDNEHDNDHELSDDVHFASDATWMQPQLSDDVGHLAPYVGGDDQVLCADSLHQAGAVTPSIDDDGYISPDEQDDDHEYEILDLGHVIGENPSS